MVYFNANLHQIVCQQLSLQFYLCFEVIVFSFLPTENLFAQSHARNRNLIKAKKTLLSFSACTNHCSIHFHSFISFHPFIFEILLKLNLSLLPALVISLLRNKRQNILFIYLVSEYNFVLPTTVSTHIIPTFACNSCINHILELSFSSLYANEDAFVAMSAIVVFAVFYRIYDDICIACINNVYERTLSRITQIFDVLI